jgi:ABC-type molybdate transport system substrate-binding protein
MTGTAQPETAESFIAFLVSPAGRNLLAANGVTLN